MMYIAPESRSREFAEWNVDSSKPWAATAAAGGSATAAMFSKVRRGADIGDGKARAAGEGRKKEGCAPCPGTAGVMCVCGRVWVNGCLRARVSACASACACPCVGACALARACVRACLRVRACVPARARACVRDVAA